MQREEHNRCDGKEGKDQLRAGRECNTEVRDDRNEHEQDQRPAGHRDAGEGELRSQRVVDRSGDQRKQCRTEDQDADVVEQT